VIVQFGEFSPAQLERVPQTVWVPAKEPLMNTSTPAPPAVQVSLPVRSVAPTIVEVIVAPAWTA
jgi:hypothetical protein